MLQDHLVIHRKNKPAMGRQRTVAAPTDDKSTALALIVPSCPTLSGCHVDLNTTHFDWIDSSIPLIEDRLKNLPQHASQKNIDPCISNERMMYVSVPATSEYAECVALVLTADTNEVELIYIDDTHDSAASAYVVQWIFECASTLTRQNVDLIKATHVTDEATNFLFLYTGSTVTSSNTERGFDHIWQKENSANLDVSLFKCRLMCTTCAECGKQFRLDHRLRCVVSTRDANATTTHVFLDCNNRTVTMILSASIEPLPFDNVIA